MRKSGLAKADKKAARVAAEGTLAVERAGLSAVLVEVNSETDFVARSDEFQAFAREVAKAALDSSAASVEALVQTAPGRGTIEEQRRALVAKIGENIAVRRFVRMTAPGALGTYLHGTRIGALVALQGGDEALARDLAMHVAAVEPGLRGCESASRRGARQGAGDPHRADQGREEAARDRRQDGRGPAAQVPGGDHAARPAVRQGSGDHGREAAEEVGRQGGRSSCATKWVRASRRNRTTSSAR